MEVIFLLDSLYLAIVVEVSSNRLATSPSLDKRRGGEGEGVVVK